MAFDGAVRSCVKYALKKGGILRCDKFEEGKLHPVCPRPRKLKGGGRSQAYLRPHGCRDAPGKKTTKRKTRRAKK